MNTLGGLTANGSALITENLTVNGTISGYATQAALDRKANAVDVYAKTEADDLPSAKATATNVYTKADADDLLNAKTNSTYA